MCVCFLLQGPGGGGWEGRGGVKLKKTASLVLFSYFSANHFFQVKDGSGSP